MEKAATYRPCPLCDSEDHATQQAFAPAPSGGRCGQLDRCNLHANDSIFGVLRKVTA